MAISHDRPEKGQSHTRSGRRRRPSTDSTVGGGDWEKQSNLAINLKHLFTDVGPPYFDFYSIFLVNVDVWLRIGTPHYSIVIIDSMFTTIS